MKRALNLRVFILFIVIPIFIYSCGSNYLQNNPNDPVNNLSLPNEPTLISSSDTAILSNLHIFDMMEYSNNSILLIGVTKFDTQVNPDTYNAPAGDSVGFLRPCIAITDNNFNITRFDIFHDTYWQDAYWSFYMGFNAFTTGAIISTNQYLIGDLYGDVLRINDNSINSIHNFSEGLEWEITHVNKIVKVNDSEFFACFSGGRSGVAKLNETGDSYWFLDIPWSELNIGKTFDNMLIVAAAGSNIAGARVFKMSYNGDTVWEKAFPNGGGSNIKIISTNDGGYLLLAGSYIYKLNGQGDTDWEFLFDKRPGENRSYGYSTPKDILEISSNQYIVVGDIRGDIQGDIYTENDWRFLSINSSGILLWDKTYDTPDDDSCYGAFKIYNNILILGTDSYAKKDKIFKIDAQGNIITSW